MLAINIATIPLIIKNLGAVNYGILAFLKLFNHEGFFSYFEFGMQTILSKKAAANNGSANNTPHGNLSSVFSTFASIGLIFSIVSALLIVTFKWQFLSFFQLSHEEVLEVARLLIWGLLPGILSVPYFLCVGILEGKHNYDLVNVVDFLISFLTATAFLICAYFSAPLTYFVVSEVAIVCSLMCITIGYVFFKHLSAPGYFKFSLDVLKSNKHEIISLSNVKASSLIFHNSDKVIISLFFGPTVLGIFELLLKIPKIIKGLGAPTAQILLPLAAELAKPNGLNKIALYSIISSLIISVTCSMGIAFYYHEIFDNFLKLPVGFENITIFFFLLAWSSLTPLTQVWNIFIAQSHSLTKYTRNVYLSLLAKILTMVTAYFWGNVMLGAAYLMSMIVQIPSITLVVLELKLNEKFFTQSLLKIVISAIGATLISKCFLLLLPERGPITTFLGLIVWGAVMAASSFLLIFEELRLKIKNHLLRIS